MAKPLDPAILQQLLHRALGMIGTIALATVVIFNWILSHVANAWVMPPEVQSAFQALFTSIGVLWIFRHFGLAALRADSGALVDGTVPLQPEKPSPLAVPASPPSPPQPQQGAPKP